MDPTAPRSDRPAPAAAGAPSARPDLALVDPDRLESLLSRYAGAGPRYTSYPTAPVWSEAYAADRFRRDLGVLAPGGDVSVYVHVPFCRRLCHFCACNRIITRDAALPQAYLDTVERELDLVRAAAPEGLGAVQHHWGGGTPTHLTPDQVRRLFRAVDARFPARKGAEISLEVDPRVTGEAHVEALRECGFRRLSLGVQDFDPRVQRAIHREQSVEQTARLVEAAREAGFASVSFDLIYGLPFQSDDSFERTLATVVALEPDRIALYGYAHVTWVAKQQRGFERTDLPGPTARLRILATAIRRLLAAGYTYIGLDHFAKPEDELSRALADRTLRRNFMGYTTRAGLDLLGFGPSAISELAGSYAQSQRALGAWGDRVREGSLATLRGHALTPEDQRRRWVIQRIMCLGAVDAGEYRARFGEPFGERFAGERTRLEPLAADGLVRLDPDGSLAVSTLGQLVLRNVAMVFDAYLPGQQREARPLFSQTV